jgi:hypothetical protein
VGKGGAAAPPAAALGAAFQRAGAAVTLPAGVSSSTIHRAFVSLGRVLAKRKKERRPQRLKPIKPRRSAVVPVEAVLRRPRRSGAMTRHQLYAYFKRIGKLDLFFYMHGM